MRCQLFLAPVAFAIFTASAAAPAEDLNHFLSNKGTIAFLALGAGLPLLQDGHQGPIHTFRTLDSLGVSVLLSEGIKHVTHVRRPDSDERDSFPSGHATAAFAVATMQAQFHPSEAPLWFAGAAAIANSRVQLHRHHWAEVIAGAALGYGTARLELSSHRGLLIYPFVTDEGGVGMLYSRRF
jgi:membrane-associated phospholipid phosphatase